MKKTETRIIAEQVAKAEGRSLIWVNAKAFELIDMGLAQSRLEALQIMLDWIQL